MDVDKQPLRARGIRRAAYIALAILFLGLAVLGAMLPVLPTTPFLLLMSYFLVRSSPWLHDQIVRIPLLGVPIRDWRENRGVRPHVKWIAYFMVLVVVILSLASQTTVAPLKVAVVLLCGIGVAIVWRLPTIPANS